VLDLKWLTWDDKVKVKHQEMMPNTDPVEINKPLSYGA